MGQPYLVCTVRGCGLPLAPHDRTLVCPAGHSYDLARSGYVNLLQPQDRRSLDAGDPKAAVEARALLLANGIGRAILDALVDRAAGLDLGDDPLVVDLGSGAGHLLGALSRRRRIRGVGIDLSTAAVEHAARRFPDLTWVVANADRRVPLADHSAALVLSQHSRRNPSECARILSPGGFLLMAIPAADDLLELRTSMGGRTVEQERGPALMAEHASRFTLVERLTVREAHRLERDALALLLRATYRGERRSAAERLKAIERLDVTLASELVLFRLREGDSPQGLADPIPDGES